MSQFVICANLICDSFILIQVILSNMEFQSPGFEFIESDVEIPARPYRLCLHSEAILAETVPYSLCFRASATPIHKPQSMNTHTIR